MLRMTLLAAFVVVLTSGCVASDGSTSLAGGAPFETESAACAVLGGSSKLRGDESAPSRVDVYVDSAEQSVGDELKYSITGHTQVQLQKSVRYDWTCTVLVSEDRHNLSAELDQFNQATTP